MITSFNNEQEPGICSSCVGVLQSIGNLRDDVALLRELCDELAERQLRELSTEVWNVIFDIIDRYLFLISFGVAVFTPAFLFLILPPGASEVPHIMM